MAVKKAVFSLSTLASFIAPAPSFSLFEEANENSIDCVSKYPAKYSYFKGNGKRISKGPRVCICLFEADAVKSSWVKFHPDPVNSQMDWVKLSQEQIAQQIWERHCWWRPLVGHEWGGTLTNGLVFYRHTNWPRKMSLLSRKGFPDIDWAPARRFLFFSQFSMLCEFVMPLSPKRSFTEKTNRHQSTIKEFLNTLLRPNQPNLNILLFSNSKFPFRVLKL